MRVPRTIRVVSWILFSVFAFCVWYYIAADYDYSAVAGTYTLQENGETSTLALRRDRTFVEDLYVQGKVMRAQGRWRRVGEGGISFSKEFLQVPGEEFDRDGNAYGYIHKSLGLLFSITLAPDAGGPTFHKKLFS
jgi:hypothetical protein